ncbi:metal ABC transporter solute-binding protein, Zn/Mn family [Microbacterium sp. R86528]|uniref:metal ABC transporter solute-binding protein, Zn/Mn family n=1 Tax=Microbacterium sp. R86528 TaxID=3093864 RepID=UPI0037CC1534
MKTPSRPLVLLGLGAASALVLSGCASTTSDATSDSETDAITVVASTNVYGQIAEVVGADLVEVTSIVTNAAQDPHSFEASARDQLTVEQADLVIENGGGYDSFMDSLVEASGSEAHVITAAEFSHSWPTEEGEEDHSDHDHDEEDEEHADEDDHAGHDHIEGFNEHVWYDPHTMAYVADAIAEELGEISPDDAEIFTANAEAFHDEIEGLEESLEEIDAAHAGDEAFLTEPVGGYLVIAAGLEDVTPSEFSEAVEEGQDVAPATLLEALSIVTDGELSVMITNTQTGGAETAQVVTEAEKEAIPVVAFSETLPEGQTYISWMQENIENLAAALDS